LKGHVEPIADAEAQPWDYRQVSWRVVSTAQEECGVFFLK
jgi:hypothetical protein